LRRVLLGTVWSLPCGSRKILPGSLPLLNLLEYPALCGAGLDGEGFRFL
jgi:hypothetical protein